MHAQICLWVKRLVLFLDKNCQETNKLLLNVGYVLLILPAIIPGHGPPWGCKSRNHRPYFTDIPAHIGV